MANYFNLELDTLGPQGVALDINSGATYTTNPLVTLGITTTDTTTTGYTMKIWGDLDIAQAIADGILAPGSTTATEADALWITYVASKQVKLDAATEGTKTVNCKLRDDVYNPSAQATDTIILDTALPVVTITGPDVDKISKQASKDTSSFSFVSSEDIVEYKVKVVATAGAAHDTGTQIPTAGGSINMSGGAVLKDVVTNCSIKGTDLESASAGDGTKIVKVFVKDAAGNWSI